MMPVGTFEYLIQTYGYWALLAGTFVEGETILLLGGVAAQMGYLDLSMVMVVSFIGSFSGDQAYFFIGRIKGQEMLRKHPKWQARADRVHHYLERYHDMIMLGFRFIYGIRIMTPFVLAMNPRIKTRRFVIFNACGALIWSIAVAGGGYLFGHAIEIILNDIKNCQIWIIVAIAVICPCVWLFHIYRKRKKNKGSSNIS